MSSVEKSEENNFCYDCGEALRLEIVPLPCQSKSCQKCNRTIYFRNITPEGGFKFDVAGNFHMDAPRLTLDPSSTGLGGYLTRPGLDLTLRQLFLCGGIDSHSPFIDFCKKQELELDKKLGQLEYLNHLDFNTPEDSEEAIKILERENDKENLCLFYASLNFGLAHKNAEEDEIEDAMHAAFNGALYSNLSVLESKHFREITWLGYECYNLIVKNNGFTKEMAIERKLVDSVVKKISSLQSDLLIVISNSEDSFQKKLGVKGISESALRALVEEELNSRNQKSENQYKEREINIKEKDTKIKYWHLYVIIFALFAKILFDYTTN